MLLNRPARILGGQNQNPNKKLFLLCTCHLIPHYPKIAALSIFLSRWN